MERRRGIVDAMVIGAQKAGTSWLWEALRRRDDVFTPPVKELHHYDHRHCPAHRAWTRGHLRRGVRGALRWHINRAAPFDRDWIDYLVDLSDRDPFSTPWYRAAFARARPGALRLDATPEYASLPPAGVAEIFEDNPDLRAIHVLRDPVDRALSQIRMGFARRKTLAPDRAAWEAALADPDLADRSDYARHLAVWDAAGAAVLRLDFAGLEQDPARFLDRVEAHLGLKRGPRPETLAEKVHAGPVIETPDWVREQLTARLAPQREAMRAALAAPPRGAAEGGLAGRGRPLGGSTPSRPAAQTRRGLLLGLPRASRPADAGAT